MKILIELSPVEFKHGIKSGKLEALVDDLSTADEEVGKVAAVTKKQKSSTTKKDTPKTQKANKPEPDPEPEPEAPAEDPVEQEESGDAAEYSLEDVRAILVKVQKANGKKAVSELLSKFDVKKLTDVDESDYADLIEAAEAL